MNPLQPLLCPLIPMPTRSTPDILRVRRLFRPQPCSSQRSTLRDLYTFGLMSVFRRDSIFRVWEPLRETPQRPTDKPNGNL